MTVLRITEPHGHLRGVSSSNNSDIKCYIIKYVFTPALEIQFLRRAGHPGHCKAEYFRVQLRVLSLVQHKRASSSTILILDYLVLHQDPFCPLSFETNHPCFIIQNKLLEMCANWPSPSPPFMPFTSCFRRFSHCTRDVIQCEFAGALLRRLQAKTPENKDTPHLDHQTNCQPPHSAILAELKSIIRCFEQRLVTLTSVVWPPILFPCGEKPLKSRSLCTSKQTIW